MIYTPLVKKKIHNPGIRKHGKKEICTPCEEIAYPWSMISVISLVGEAKYEKESEEKKEDELGAGQLSDSHILMPAMVKCNISEKH